MPACLTGMNIMALVIHHAVGEPSSRHLHRRLLQIGRCRKKPSAAYFIRVTLMSTDRSLTLDMPPQSSSFPRRGCCGKIPWVRLDIPERRSGF